MHVAAKKGHAEVTEMLISKDKDKELVMLSGRDDWTALHFAAKYGHLDVVTALVEHGSHTLVQMQDAVRIFSPTLLAS